MTRLAGRAAIAAAAVVALLAGAAAVPAAADARVLRTALPLVVLKTDRAIPNDPKVRTRVRIIDRRRGPNRTRDRGNVYAGFGGIELRGHSSLAFPKKQYGLELRDRRGEGRDAGLLGMPEDDDWVLSAPYSDKSLMRNALAYETARRSFGRYAPRTRYVEVVLNRRYRGVYVLTQKLELGKGRIEDGEGDGWLMELVFGYQARGERRFTGPRTRRPLLFSDPDDPSRKRAREIRGAVSRFEHALYGKRFRSRRAGWRRHLDARAAVDYALLQELFNNQDGFHASTYFHRPVGKRIVLGPIWDFDIAMGNTTFGRFRSTRGHQFLGRPIAERLYRDRGFKRAMRVRWRQLRRQGLQRQIRRSIGADARRLSGPQARNFRRWRILGRYVWPNPVDPRTGRYRPSWSAEVRYLRRWTDSRIRWLDRALR